MRVPGTVEGLWIKRVRRGPMDETARMRLEAGKGITGNADRGGARQVTIIEREQWDRMMEEVATPVPPSVRRANVMVSGCSLEESRGRTLAIGDCRIEIRGETRPCRLMEESCAGLQEAMRTAWRGGAYGVVTEGGDIALGDTVQWVDETGGHPSS